MIHKHLKLAAGFTAALGISACTAGQTGPPNQTTVDPVQNGNTHLSLAVGTANIAGQAAVGLNVVALYRQKDGSSGVLLDTPKLTGAFTLPAAVAARASASGPYDINATADRGPTAAEVSGAYIGGSPQPAQIGAPSSVNTTFGKNGGLFGNGFAPGNYGTSGVPASYLPYYQPYYAGTNVAAGDVVTTSNAFRPTASAPAFDPAGNGQGPTGPNFPHNGLSLGLNVFNGVVPAAGAYTLSVAIPTTGNTLSPTPASATLANAGVVLPIATIGGAAPAVTFPGDGSVTVTNVAIAAPIVGAFVQLIDYGPTDVTAGGPAAGCNGATVSKPVFYTQWITATGAATIANANAPYGQTVAVCTAALNAAAAGGTDTFTGDRLQVVVIGYDYDSYSLQYNGKTGATYPEAPGLPAQADSSISLSTYATSP